MVAASYATWEAHGMNESCFLCAAESGDLFVALGWLDAERV